MIPYKWATLGNKYGFGRLGSPHIQVSIWVAGVDVWSGDITSSTDLASQMSAKNLAIVSIQCQIIFNLTLKQPSEALADTIPSGFGATTFYLIQVSIEFLRLKS